MKTQDIKNMGQALQQVQESSKAALAKKLAKASQSSEKGKAAVTLPKAPFEIPKKDASEDVKELTIADVQKATAMAKKRQEKERKAGQKGVSTTDLAARQNKNEALKGDQHKLDHDDDGDIDAADFKGLRKKKKGEKAEVKPRQETETDKGKEAPMEKTESTRWPVYARIMEKKSHTAGATPPEEMDSKDSPTAKKMKADHKPEVNDTEAKGHQDAADAGRKGPNGQARPNDQKKGDTKIVNPVQGAVTSGSN